MKKIFLILLILLSSQSYSQNKGVIKLFEEAKNDSVKIDILVDFLQQSNVLPVDSMKYYYTLFKYISQQQHDKAAEAVNLCHMSYYLYLNADLPRGLALATEGLHVAESVKNARALGIANLVLQYFASDPVKRINFLRKASSYSKIANDKHSLTVEYRNLGHLYLGPLKMPDSAFYYYQSAYDLSLKTNRSSDIVLNLIGLGSTNYLVGNKKIGLEYYKKALEIKTDNPEASVSVYTNIANYYKKENNRDSVVYYARRGYEIAKSNNFLSTIIVPSRILKDVFTGLNSDSALKYTIIYYSVNDSMYGRKKIEQIQALNFDEEMRQQRMEEEKQKEKAERKNNLQYAGMALGLITFIILFLLLSHSIIANQKLIRFLGVVALLLVFEFINLFIHPYLSHATNDSPLIMLLVMVCIAALLVPVHHRMEKWISHRLVEKNKKIRLAAAKRTIANLEGDINSQI
jgi:tetratricopeptide (TPR) repeat protein